MFFQKLFLAFVCFISIVSCVDTLDFDQIEDYSATSEYTSSLTYFTIVPLVFFNQSGVQQNEKTDITYFRFFENRYIRERAVKLDFNIEIRNEFDNDFKIQIDFLDIDNLITHSIQEISVGANNLDYKFEETVEVFMNPDIRNTSKVKVTVKIIDSTTPLDPHDTSEFNFKSSGKIYIGTDS